MIQFEQSRYDTVVTKFKQSIVDMIQMSRVGQNHVIQFEWGRCDTVIEQSRADMRVQYRKNGYDTL